MEVYYCPYCSKELEFAFYEGLTLHLLFMPCGCRRTPKRDKRKYFKVDSEGFAIEPLTVRGRYLKSRPK